MAEHALLSASGAHRWLRCSPSARLEEEIAKTIKEEPSPSAEEGTLAHAIAELKLKHFMKELTTVGYKSRLEKLKESEYYDRDMDDYTDDYVTVIKEKYAEALKRDAQATLELEQTLDFSEYVKEGFGRGDAIIIADGLMEVCDLKYGRHIQVSAVENPQLRLYGLGALHENGWLYNITEVCMTIIQPRNGGVSSETLSVKDLKSWGESIKYIAERAYKGEGRFYAGDHCRFCLAAGRCKELAEVRLKTAKKFVGKDYGLLTDSEVAQILADVDDLVSYANMVKASALQRALSGSPIEGYKLVEGRATTQYKDARAIKEVLTKEGYSEGDIMKPPELLGITAMKKVLSTKRFNELLGDYLYKPQGKPTLVPVSDKRPAIDLAEGFEDLTD